MNYGDISQRNKDLCSPLVVRISGTKNKRWQKSFKVFCHGNFCAQVFVNILLSTLNTSPYCQNEANTEEDWLQILFRDDFPTNLHLEQMFKHPYNYQYFLDNLFHKFCFTENWNMKTSLHPTQTILYCFYQYL